MIAFWACVLSSLFVQAHAQHAAHLCESGDPHFRRLSGDTSLLQTIRVCEMQVMRVQRMTKDYLLSVSYVEPAQNKQAMLATIGVFNTDFLALFSGDLTLTYASTTTDEYTVQNQWTLLKPKWESYSAFLQANVNAAGANSSATLALLETLGQAVMDHSQLALDKYIAYATLAGKDLPPVTERFALFQVMQMQKVMKEVLFISLDVKKVFYLMELNTTELILEDVQSALSYGNIVAGVPEATKMCTLHAILKVSKAFARFKTHLGKIGDTQAVSRTLLLDMAPAAQNVDDEMLSALALFELDNGTCDAASSIDDEGWAKLLAETNRQRYLTQKATRIFLQIAKNVDVASNKISLAYALSDAEASLVKLLKGSQSDNIPAPVTQAIEDGLMLTWQQFKLFDFEVRHTDYSTSAVGKVADLSKSVSDHMRKVGNMCVLAATTAKPALRNLVWEVSQRQLTLLEKMSKEALLVTLGHSVAASRAAFEFTVSAFEGSHSELLLGRLSSTANATNATNSTTAALEVMVFENKAIPRTTDACTLTIMATVMNRFDDLKVLLQQLMDDITDSAAVTIAVQRLGSLSSSATADMTTAIGYYNAGQGNCSTTLSTKVWEVSIQQTGRMQYMLQKALTEYYLLAGGFSAAWMDQSLAALEAHKGFIMENAASPRLAVALTAFKRAWDTYSSAVEETSLGLQVAYVTLNPNPLGSKDALDFFDGPQEYHTVHKEQHPFYRAILYDKDYYDIFMLDLEGNLIYSVYKEADYATNFAANGFGRWRMSGLGEAFEAAIAQPDMLHVIDWKPYGPSAGALASFLSIGVRESAEASIGSTGQLIGVYCTQMPPSSKPIDSQGMLDATITEIDQLLNDFKFSKPSIFIPAPPQQAIADRLFSVSDTWAIVQGVVTNTASDSGLIAVGNQDAPLTSASEMLVQSWVDGAWTGAPTLQGTKVAIAATQLAVVQSMCKLAVLIGAGRTNFASREGLVAMMAAFETNQLLLVDGNSTGRRLQAAMTAVQPSEDPAVVSLLDSVQSSWLGLKPTLQSIAGGGSAAEDVLRDVVSGTEGLVSSMNDAFTFFSSTTLTTTLMALEILAPMPFTGIWAAGPTMKVASLLAEGLINEQQLILPGYHLKSAFFDDKCDNAESSRIVLREMAAKDTYIALGGAGCSEVCAQTAFTASTIRLPFLSYECPAASLSDTSEYPDFTRFGTLTTDTIEVIKAIGSNFSWPAITVISGDSTKYGVEARRMQGEFMGAGFTSTLVASFEDDWPAIVSMMATLKAGSAGQKRVYFLVGNEDYLRKVICASILSGAKEGITWLSQGTWRDEWWTKQDKQAGFQRKWILEDVGGDQLKQVTADFSAAWDGFAATDEERRDGLIALYHTDALDGLDVAVNSSGPMSGPYHATHLKWHPMYRATLYSRGYYDIFLFDLRGNLIYSVYKESDYGTNFAATRADGAPLGKWVNSGLGQAFRTSVENPNNVSYIDWSPYGPSAGALAAFISTGIRDKEGVLIGVYTIQLPPDYERSIEELQPECSIQAMTEWFEGAINVAGLGKATEADSVKPLTCFDGHSAQSFNELLDRHLKEGYPIGDQATQVPDPYGDVKAHAADAICTLALTIQHLLAQGYSIAEIQNPDPMLYAKFLEYVKTQVDFQGASGRVKFSGNDRPAYLGVQQVHKGMKVDVGVVSPYSADEAATMEWVNGGPDGTVWKRENPEKDDFPWRLLQIGIPAIVCCLPTIAAIISGRRDA